MSKKIQSKLLLKRLGIGLAALILLYILWCYSLSDNVIWKNVQVNGVSLKGLTEKEATECINDAFISKYEDKYMTLSLNGADYKAYIFPLLDIQTDEIVEDAYRLGHREWYLRGLDRIHLMRSSQEKKSITLTPEIAYPEKLDSVIDSSELPKYSTVTESTALVTSDSIILKKGISGVAANIDTLKQEMLDAVARQDYQAKLKCPVTKEEPKPLDLKKYHDQIYQEVQDASLTDENEIVPSVDGISFDLKAVEKQFADAREGETIIVNFTVTSPAVSTADIKAMPFLDILGSYTTYGGGTPERITNLQLAVNAINGVELQPGETFSYSNTLGPRTEERGYKEATVIVNGQHGKDIGGGICQISSTLFVAALYADMDIAERHNHSARVDYSVDGLDAAIAWQSQDFRFTNTSAYPVRISASYVNGAVNVKLYGTKENENTVRITTEPIDANSCTTYRSIYDEAGELLETQQICTSYYRAK